MRDFIINNKIINNNQYGFIEKSNTTLSHINLQHFIFSKHNANKKKVSDFLISKRH